MKRWHLYLSLGAGLAVMAMLACAKNPLGSSAGAGPTNNGTTYNGVVEAAGPNVIFSPGSASELTTKWGGVIDYSWGGASQVLIGGVLTGIGAPPVCPNGTTSAVLDMRSPGIGGSDGKFNPSTDYYIHFEGYKGPSAACDYNSLVVAFKAGTNVDVDLTQYHGFIFYARGTGNWGVQVSGLGVKTGQAGPYSDFNYYERVFGTELSKTTWKQITVKWSDLQQLYGQAVDKTAALQKSVSLQFVQETPFTSNFTLDLDYIRLF